MDDPLLGLGNKSAFAFSDMIQVFSPSPNISDILSDMRYHTTQTDVALGSEHLLGRCEQRCDNQRSSNTGQGQERPKRGSESSSVLQNITLNPH